MYSVWTVIRTFVFYILVHVAGNGNIVDTQFFCLLKLERLNFSTI